MLAWIFAALAVFVAQTLLPATIRYLLAGPGVMGRLRIALGPRDEPPPLSVVGQRAARALANLHEAMPVFLTIALLLVIRGDTSQRAWLGAGVFVVARAAYVPAYLSGRLGVRSVIWVVSWLGLGAMISVLWDGAFPSS